MLKCAVGPIQNCLHRVSHFSKCLYERPLNIARGKRLDNHLLTVVVMLRIRLMEVLMAMVSRNVSTHQDAQPWWDLDLTNFANMDEIKIWNRTDTPHDKSVPQNQYTSRIFPCWVMISNDPFRILPVNSL